MKISEKIKEDFKYAYKSRQMEKKNFLGLVIGEITKDLKEPSDEDVIKVLRKFEKSLKSIIKANETKDFTPSDWSVEEELFLIKYYLPQQMSEEDVEMKIEESVLSGANNIGEIMNAFKDFEVDRKMVSQKIIKKLNQNK